MHTELKTRVWEVVLFGWGADMASSSDDLIRDAFLKRYFPGRQCLKPGLAGCRFSATEEEVAFCEFDCGAQIKEIVWPNSFY